MISKMIRFVIVSVLLVTVSPGWAQLTFKTIENAKFEVVVVEGNDRGRLIVRDMECDPACDPIIMIMGLGVPVYVNIDEPLNMSEFIKMKRGMADVQYDTVTNQVIKVRLQ